jgi:glutathione S-transferase
VQSVLSYPCVFAWTVIWALRVKGIDYKLESLSLPCPFVASSEFLAMNPNGLVPVLKDGDFSLFEGAAILTYLADKFEWTDLYPKDLQTRSKVNEFLHWHHTGTRRLALEVVRPQFLLKFNEHSPNDLVLIEHKEEVVKKEIGRLETFFRHGNTYIAQTDRPTLADFVAYCEIDQLEVLGCDFSEYQGISAWIVRMKTIPFHDEVRTKMVAFFTSIGLAIAK